SAEPCSGICVRPLSHCCYAHQGRPGDRRSMRILIVEDELLVRMFAVDALEDAGFEVREAGTAAEAIHALDQLGDQVAAIIIDLGLPDRSGDQLAVELRELRPELPIVIASGRSEREIRERFAGDSRLGILVKPYTASMLLDSLEQVGVKS